jgi:hypothetical protein
VTEALALRVTTADVVIVKGDTPAGDRIGLAFPDGTSCRAVAHVLHDLPHLVVESAFGIDDGLWGALASRRDAVVRLVRDFPSGDPAWDRDWPGRVVARAATGAVVNLWRDGPNTPGGVRDRLLASAKHETRQAVRIEDLAARLDDDTIRAARIGVRYLYSSWRTLSAGGRLRLTWPLLPA